MTWNDHTATRPTVAVVGGGYGGTAVAKALDETANVVLIEAKDAFMHNVAALRALVDPSWLAKISFPYDGLLAHGRVIQDRATTVDQGRVVTASGQVIDADYVVLATGSAYPFPAKSDETDTDTAHEQFRSSHRALAQADRVLLLGAGAVGIELAGEIRHVWPTTPITLVDPAPELLGSTFKPELKAELHRQLSELDVEILLGTSLRQLPSSAPGELGPFTVTTDRGVEITADLWFRCFGVVPNSDYLGDTLRSARRADGFIEVGPTLQVAGQTTVFALGDVAAADAKMAALAGAQAQTVIANITALASGSSPLTDYQSMGPGIGVTIGPNGGAGQLPGHDEIVGADVISEMKGKAMMIGRFAELFGLEPVPVD